MPVEATEPVYTLYTSVTTGMPKVRMNYRKVFCTLEGEGLG